MCLFVAGFIFFSCSQRALCFAESIAQVIIHIIGIGKGQPCINLWTAAGRNLEPRAKAFV